MNVSFAKAAGRTRFLVGLIGLLLGAQAAHVQPASQRSVVLQPERASAALREALRARFRHSLSSAVSAAFRSEVRLRRSRFSSALQAEDRPHAGWLVLGGLGGGIGGLLIGGTAGGLLTLGQGVILPPGILPGGAVGATLGIPLGVHLANGRDGNYLWAALWSVGAAGLGLVLAGGPDPESGGLPDDAVAGATVGLQIGVSIAVERITGD